MQKVPSRVVTLPAWMNRPVKKLYNTRSGGRYQPDDVALAFALSLRMHDSADQLRRLARRLVDKVCLEHQPNMKRLAREPDDAKVFDAALKIINRVCHLLDIGPGATFVRNGGDDGSDAAAA
ncbi:hypothetical protein QEM27_002719 [Pseudomonas putida]|nr:hypothetical protein [Pseudomonas putida]EKT8866920.1 hypothetical protein [Pseudomonas putida]